MRNKITGKIPEPIADEEVELTENPSAMELCKEVKRLTEETREALLEQALAVSNEKCNALISRLTARVLDLTQQVRKIEWTNDVLAKNLKEDVERVTKDIQEENMNLSLSLRATLQMITKTVREIQNLLTTTMGKATDETMALLGKRITVAAISAVEVIGENSNELVKNVQNLEKEVDKVRSEIYYESGFRKFFFWVTPILLLVHGIMTIILLLR